MAKQCLSSKNKSLWKRTRIAKKKAIAAGGDGAAAAPPAAPAALTATTARALLDKALATFIEPANKAKLVGIVEECNAAGEAEGGVMKMTKLLPAVQTMLAPTLKEFGYKADDLMTVASSLLGFGASDPTIGADTMKLMKAAQGDLSDFV